MFTQSETYLAALLQRGAIIFTTGVTTAIVIAIELSITVFIVVTFFTVIVMGIAETTVIGAFTAMSIKSPESTADEKEAVALPVSGYDLHAAIVRDA